MGKRLLPLLLCLILCLSPAAYAVEDAPASGEVGNSTVTISVTELKPGYYLCAVWDGDVLLTLFDYTVGSDGKMETTVDVGTTLEAGDRLQVGISGANTGSRPAQYEVVLDAPAQPEGPASPSRPGSENPSAQPGGFWNFGWSGGGLVVPDESPAPSGPGNDTVSIPEQVQNPWRSPFADVAENAWYYDAVRFVCEQGLMRGMGEGVFAPGAGLSRAQLAQILYNQAGCPGGSACQFTDVAAGAWYYDAVAWAVEQGVATGYGGGLFGPDDLVTREQMAVMLWRYAGASAPGSADTGFADAGQISLWALDAVRWAAEKNVLSGKEGRRFDPKGITTRAEAAQMLKNYIEYAGNT